ncbi:hypothetical protein [Mycobacteroides chelonae]|jgi:hypothetical protein|uniref:hypothetical protein n=1 Tax=Mycobacteroides chelonae TaxID=1774 RepID=UPI000920D5D5|nr:hypothetical protein [Mycobacteroides chelonae]MBF9352462.1 hypothetical protein [Mycobacteroides chelonae]OHU40085.1 hypothetical protein BKG80_08595 [Mycobacteroides chelonae]QQG97284.1 hypothetical protein HBE99_10945 [Mycobacteroides chelonae]
MRYSACATAALAAILILTTPARGEPECQFSGGLGPDAACTQSTDDDELTTPWMWPGDDGFGVGFGGPGFGWR